VAVIDNTINGSVTTSVVNYVIADQLNTPRAVTNSAGAVIWQWAYQSNPFGEQQPTSTAGYVLNLRYPGQYFDAEIGMNYNMFRTYLPATGRYLQSDPAGLLGGISTYAYVTNNSLNYFDPYGLSGASTGAAWGAAIGGGIGVLGAGAATWATAGGNAPFIAPETAWAIGAGTTIGAAIGAAIGNDSGASGAYAQAPDNAYDPNGPKAPGKPGPAEGFIDPKAGENWVPNPFPGRGGASHGWEDSKGRVWCPTGQGGRAHGGPHWDVQDPKTGGNTNVPPGINVNDL